MIGFFSVLSAICICLGLFLWVFFSMKGRKNKLVLEEEIKKNPKFAILVPARDESRVIEDLLVSIENQTHSILMKQVYVIVESEEDPTVNICEKHGASVVVRKHLELKSKGYALKEAVEYLEEKKLYYDAYFIFDADNVLDAHYLEEMEKDYQLGYGISTGYRNFKNGNANVVAAAAGLTYVFMNEWLNRSSIKHQKNIMLSGTGFYIHGRYIREWKTYPFHSLTEDAELSYYATLKGISTHYNDQAIFYDEQPETFRQSVTQRKRWIRGYFQNWFAYMIPLYHRLKDRPSNIGSVWSMLGGISSVLFLVLGILFLLIAWMSEPIFSLIVSHDFSFSIFFLFIAFVLWIYFMLVLITFWIIKGEKGKLNLSKKMQFQVLWYHPIFLFSYVYVFFLTLIPKKIGWDKIEHGKSF